MYNRYQKEGRKPQKSVTGLTKISKKKMKQITSLGRIGNAGDKWCCMKAADMLSGNCAITDHTLKQLSELQRPQSCDQHSNCMLLA